ncbi:hypothetical protein AB6E20_11285 [Vibrio cyclitrophicus]
MKASYVVTTGWWCNKADDHRETCFGDGQIREKDFFQKWYNAVTSFTSPEKILVVDSNSPIPPNLPTDKRLEFISLDINAGHSTNHVGKFCGVTRAHILGMQYALLCDVDYWVYIEQDALIYGHGIVEKAIEKMDKGIMFGCGRGTPQPMQQSFMIMHKDQIWDFLKRLNGINKRDNEISPEMKFAIASSSFLSILPEFIFLENKSKSKVRKFIYRVVSSLIKLNMTFDILPFGYGRKRPINFSDKTYYFQHGEQAELDSYNSKLY